MKSRLTGGLDCHKESRIRSANRNETRFSLTIVTIGRNGPMRSFIFGSGQEPGQVNAQRLNGEASICKAVKRRFRFPGISAKRTRLRREQAVG